MAKARIWSKLSDAYRKRLERGGIDKKSYEGGASLKAARGHRATPEHPSQAYKPGAKAKFPRYRASIDRLQEDVIERKIQLFGNRFKFNRERSEEFVMSGSVDIPMPGIKELRRILRMTDDEIEEMLVEPDLEKTWRFMYYH